MERVRSGSAGLTVNPLCPGTMTLGADADQDTSTELLDLAIDGGLNFADTTKPCNDGVSGPIVGKWPHARNNRDHVIENRPLAGTGWCAAVWHGPSGPVPWYV